MATLLDVPNRKELPPFPTKGRPCLLVELVTLYPEAYKHMMSLIRSGVSGHVAAATIDVSEHTFYGWAKRGRADARIEEQIRQLNKPFNPDLEEEEIEPNDTYYYRFFMDVRRAIAQKRSECETDIAISSPKLWLSNGPGKLFGNDYVENPKLILENEPPQKNLLDAKTPVPELENHKPDKTSTYIEVDESSSFQALEALEEADIQIDVTDDDEDPKNKPDEEKKLNVEPDEEPDEKEDFGAGLEGMDETGRNMAYTTFRKISQYILDAFDMLANLKDKEVFIDYLLTNTKLYFDKFESELQNTVDEPESPEG